MKGFLFDENVPLPLRFVPSLPVVHATALGSSLSGGELWTYAAKSELVIVSKDVDNYDAHVLHNRSTKPAAGSSSDPAAGAATR